MNRENDELTRALGNPEHGGRVRGRGVGVSWKEGFSQDEDRYGYRSRKRKKDREADQFASIQRELAGLKQQMAEVLQRGSSSSRPQEDPVALDVISQRVRSSVTSTEVLAEENALTDDAPAPPRYPVDDVREVTDCELHEPLKNMSIKVASDTALPCGPETVHHGRPIPAGYARVTVGEIVPEAEELEIDFPTPEGAVKLIDVYRNVILWKKRYIKFPGSAPSPPSPRGPPPPRSDPPPPPSPPAAPRQATPPPSPHPSRQATPLPPNPPPKGGQKQQGPKKGQKRGRATSTLNTEPYQPKTTRIPEPSQKPLPVRAYDRTPAETEVIVAGEVKAHFEKLHKKLHPEPEPSPKELLDPKTIDHFRTMISGPSQTQMALPTDYERELRIQNARFQEAKRKGKQIPQLGEQANQSVPPLIVSSDIDKDFRADMDKDM